MTYSRPGTSTVNALFLPAKPADLPGVERRVINVGENGRYLDFSNPAQAGRNAGQGMAEFGSFLSKLIETGAPVYKSYLQGQGQEQAGEFLKNVDVAQLYRGADNDQRNLLKSLNPFAQDLVQDAAAKAATRSYLEVLAANRAKNTVLSNPYAPEADRAKAEADVRNQAMEATGIKNVPDAALAPYLGTVAETEANLRGDAYKAQLQKKSDDFDAQVEKGLRTTLLGIDQARLPVIEAGDEAASGQSAEQYIATRTEALQAVQRHHDQFVSSGTYTSKQYAERWAMAFSTEFNARMAADDIPGAMRLLGTVDGIAKGGEIKTPGGVSLWEIKLGDGDKTIASMVDGLSAQLKPKFDQWQQEQLVKQFGPDMVAAAQGDEGARGRVTAMLPMLANDPQALGQVVGQLGQMQNFARTPTEAQLRQQALLEIGLNDPNRDQKAFVNRVQGSDLTMEQKISLLNRNTQPQDPTLGLVGAGTEHVKTEIQQAAIDIAKRQKAAGSNIELDDLAKTAYQDLTIQVTKQTEKRIKALIAAGETVTPIRAAELARNEAEAIRNSRLKDAKSNVPQRAQSFDEKAMGELNYVQEQLKSTGGVGTIRVFPQSVLDAARKQGIPMDYRNVQRYFLNRISVIKDPQGKPAFPDPQKQYRQMVEAAKPKGGGGLPPSPLRQGIQLGTEATRGLMQMLQNSGLDTPAAPKPQQPRPSQPKPQGSSAKPQEQSKANPVQQVLTAGLNALVGVIAPPAAAAEMPRGGAAPRPASGGNWDSLLNSGGAAVMARLWSGAERVSHQTPGLPQVSAAASAQPIGLAINNVMHPIFVAIGISEGTRTPAGGYTRAYYGHTDPGNGAHNVGTVSGQQGGSPQATDRRWMAILSQRAVQVAPVLRQLGVNPGTVAYNRLMFNVLDLAVQAPAAVGDFVRKLPQVLRAGATIEAVAKARADSFFNPATGRLDASGFGNSYSRLLSDQRSRAGVFDYKRRL